MSGAIAPVVSVVIPAFNIADHVGRCLDSVLAQDLTRWDCIIVDDGSTDDTAERVQAIVDSRIRVVRQSNQGVSAARNAGLSLVKGRYVMFLDGDDILHPTALSRLVAPLDADPSPVASFGPFLKILETGTPYPQQKPLHLQTFPTGDVLKAILRENFLANGGHVLVRTATARAVGGFDPALRLSEDWEFWCRLAASGAFYYIGGCTEVFYLRLRTGGASGGLAADWTNHEASLKAVLGNAALQGRFSPGEWRRLRRQVQASHLWEAGRVNFTLRRFREARLLMMRSLAADLRPKHVVLFGLAQLSHLTNSSIVSRLRFVDHDQRAIKEQAARVGRS